MFFFLTFLPRFYNSLELFMILSVFCINKAYMKFEISGLFVGIPKAVTMFFYFCMNGKSFLGCCS